MREWLYNLLLRKYDRLRSNLFYDRLFSRLVRTAFPVRTFVHGQKLLLPSNYSYPIVCRNHATFNNPYLELVYQTHKSRQKPLTIIDVGAAVGDSYFFIYSNIPEAVQTIYCVEGSTYFLWYLEQNLKSQQAAVILPELLSDKEEDIPELILHHGSSAMAAGAERQRATTLDRLFEKGKLTQPDLIKIDVDGYDGKVLKGAATILQQFQPAVIFEYHPGLIKAAGNDLLLPFTILEKTNYRSLYWYDKFGNFSYHTTCSETEQFQQIATDSLNGTLGDDWHYDIIALADPENYHPAALKECSFAAMKRYPY